MVEGPKKSDASNLYRYPGWACGYHAGMLGEAAKLIMTHVDHITTLYNIGLKEGGEYSVVPRRDPKSRMLLGATGISVFLWLT